MQISAAVRKVVEENRTIHFGMQKGLYNLTKLAEYVRPTVETLMGKNVSTSSVLMALSRLQRTYSGIRDRTLGREEFVLSDMTVQTDLTILTYAKTPDAHKSAGKLIGAVHEKRQYAILTESTRELTLILEKRAAEGVATKMPDPPTYRNTSIAGVSVRFSERYTVRPGLIYALVEQLELAHVNIIELTSTHTELTFYVDRSAMTLTFDVLHRRFMA